MTARACRKSRKSSCWAANAIAPPVIGRFAPSPTGRLHAGSLLAAVGSYVSAKHQGGQWLLRIEDLDPPRTEAGAREAILASLQAHGLHWDGPVLDQLPRAEHYETALQKLKQRNLLYPCRCSRSQLLAHHTRLGTNSERSICTGKCQVEGVTLSSTDISWRLRTELAGCVYFTDTLRGELHSHLHNDIGDIVLKRRDGLYAYQLAVVVDDAATGVTEVVRGVDLLDNTARQCWLMTCLDLPRPHYLHLPLVTAANGQKLSKQNHAPALSNACATENIWQALTALGQVPSPTLRQLQPAQILDWACTHWQPNHIPHTDSSS